MSRRPITIELYGKILAGFRESPGDYNYAAKKAGCYWRTAKKAWDEGFPQYPWGEPVKEVIAREMAEAREKMATLRDAQGVARSRAMEDASQRAADATVAPAVNRAAVRQHAVEARQEEGELVRLARENAIQLLNNLSDVGKYAADLAQRFAHEIEGAELKPGAIMKLFKDFAQAAKQANEMAEMAIKMERLVLGEPTEIMGVLPVEMTTEQAIEEILEANAAMVRASELGLLKANQPLLTAPEEDASVIEADVTGDGV